MCAQKGSRCVAQSSSEGPRPGDTDVRGREPTCLSWPSGSVQPAGPGGAFPVLSPDWSAQPSRRRPAHSETVSHQLSGRPPLSQLAAGATDGLANGPQCHQGWTQWQQWHLLSMSMCLTPHTSHLIPDPSIKRQSRTAAGGGVRCAPSQASLGTMAGTQGPVPAPEGSEAAPTGHPTEQDGGALPPSGSQRGARGQGRLPEEVLTSLFSLLPPPLFLLLLHLL